MMQDVSVSKDIVIDRRTVGVYLPHKPTPEPWRLLRTYARELRDMNMAAFINRAKDIRLAFIPNERDLIGKGFAMPGQSLGINHRRLESGVTLRAPRRTKIRIR